MSEIASRPLAYDWDHRFEDEPSLSGEDAGPTLVVIDDDGQERPLAGQELDRRGLGHIVTTAARAIPPQRKPPPEETIPPGRLESRQPYQDPQQAVPDTSIYLG